MGQILFKPHGPSAYIDKSVGLYSDCIPSEGTGRENCGAPSAAPKAWMGRGGAEKNPFGDKWKTQEKMRGETNQPTNLIVPLFKAENATPELRSGCTTAARRCNPQQTPLPVSSPNLNAVLTAGPAPRTMLSYKRSSTSAQRNPERRHLQLESIRPSAGGRGGLRENK